MAPLRIGILGAARIAPAALLKPARVVREVDVVAVAARDRARAERFAHRHRIATVHRSYDELLADPHVDAVYNPLPNGLHGRWTIAALRAGKHVPCEKPFAANADEAREVAGVAAHTGLVVMEAFHDRDHPHGRDRRRRRARRRSPSRELDVHGTAQPARHPPAAPRGRRIGDGPRLLHAPNCANAVEAPQRSEDLLRRNW